MTHGWLNQKGYRQGLFWALLVCLISCLNDVMVKLAGSRLDPAQVAFFRFFFSTLTLLPFMVPLGKKAFQTTHLNVHAIRSLLLFLAVAPWCYGVIALPLTLATTISFTTPLFVLVLAAIFLKESVGWQRALATFAGFLGILVSFHPTLEGFNLMALVLVASTLMFATLDIINKKLLIADEGMLSMLFYSALGTAILAAPLAFWHWQTPTVYELFCLITLGGGANLILFCLLKAFAATDVSALQPVRYVELLFSVFFGLVLFREIPTWSTLIGAAIIIPATLYIAYVETHQRRARRTQSQPPAVVAAAREA